MARSLLHINLAVRFLLAVLAEQDGSLSTHWLRSLLVLEQIAISAWLRLAMHILLLVHVTFNLSLRLAIEHGPYWPTNRRLIFRLQKSTVVLLFRRDNTLLCSDF